MSQQKRLRWRCRRGMKELDVMFCRILDQDFPGFSSDQQSIFEAFLETPDPVIMDWVMGRNSDYPEHYQFLVCALARYE